MEYAILLDAGDEGYAAAHQKKRLAIDGFCEAEECEHAVSRYLHQAVKDPSAAGAEVYRAACTLDDTSEAGFRRGRRNSVT